MPRTALTPISILGPYPTLPVSATTLNLTMSAADVANGNSFLSTGKEILVVQNTDSGAHTITLGSIADALKRTGDITSYSVGAGLIAAFNFTGLNGGWVQTDGTINVNANDVSIKFAVIRLP